MKGSDSRNKRGTEGSQVTAFDVAGGNGRMAVLQDPQGAVFEVIKMTGGQV
jgi:predicted enzyme related to lactoylglutathione lyase